MDVLANAIWTDADQRTAWRIGWAVTRDGRWHRRMSIESIMAKNGRVTRERARNMIIEMVVAGGVFDKITTVTPNEDAEVWVRRCQPDISTKGPESA